MPKEKYTLVNPHINGKMETTFSGKTPLDAAIKSYNTLSKYFNNSIPKYFFTMQKVSDTKIGGGRNNNYFHFKVSEKKVTNGKDKYAEYVINPINIKKNNKEMTDFKKTLSGFINKQGGDYKYSDEDEWLDDEYDKIKYKNTSLLISPISHYWYYPYIYRPVIKYWFTPTFTTPVTPRIQVHLPSLN